MTLTIHILPARNPTEVDAMNIRLTSFACAMLLIPLWMCPALAKAQTPRQQAEQELTRKAPNAGLQACSLITRADVKNAAGRDPFVDAEPAGQGGWMCNIGISELKVYAGPKSWEAWESTLKSFKMDKEPQTPAPGFGERAYFLYPKPANKYQSNIAVLVTKSGNHTLVLSLDAPQGKPAESMRPALESLMKTILARLP
ncbi:protein of unknown function [Nitrospira japonica]|uniref:DUF3558 domain-containing protein n=1 Tax=Nitrospira japonica TaxID=1325564 RepID=A0A1W1I5M9_9BACT|nr:hypothetical protein [Nitrospira japonica]SLM48241.1 protein of unknown function [Nitrospira japonica]